MLDIKNVEKTFNPGTINEKKALNCIDLHLDEELQAVICDPPSDNTKKQEI